MVSVMAPANAVSRFAIHVSQSGGRLLGKSCSRRASTRHHFFFNVSRVWLVVTGQPSVLIDKIASDISA